MRAYVPLDTSAVAAGADAVATAFASNGVDVVRTGSRGLSWAEPLVEITTDHGRVAYANVIAADAAAVIDQGQDHPKCLGPVAETAYLRDQTRAVFSRVGEDHPLALPKTTVLQDCLDQAPEALIATIETSGLRGRGGAGFPAHIKWRTVFDTPASRSTSSATPTRATPGRSPTASCSKAIPIG